MNSLGTLPPLRQVIRDHGLAAKKSLGQNFLLDLNLTAKIARLAGDLTGHDVLEVGPGPGGLTRGLLAEGARRVLVVEKDARFLPAPADISTACPGRVLAINADALSLDPVEHLTPPAKVVANLPYNMAAGLLVHWLTPDSWPPWWESLTLMFQEEVAQRIVARPGGKDYGRLSILSQWRCDARVVLTLPPEAFTPSPKVHSSVVHMIGRKQPLFPANADILSRVVAQAFNQRRKMLRASLRGFAPDIAEHLSAAGLRPTDRAEQVPVEGFCALARSLARTA